VLLARLAGCWLRLARRARRLPAPDAVVVGYLGHFDVHLARLLFRGVPVVLDHLIGASDTARDRRVRGGFRQRALRILDRAALAAADIVVVDTDEHLAAVPARYRDRGVVVPVGAPQAWFDAGHPPDAGHPSDAGRSDLALRVVFFGLYTPLQGTPVIGEALGRLTGAPIDVTMVGGGQDLDETRRAASANTRVVWRHWVPAAELPALVAAHDVCLGIFGTGQKARRVVPNKVFQGAAAGCAVVTSDTGPQRRALGGAGVLVPPGDPVALADALRRLAADRATLVRLRAAARERAERSFAAVEIVTPLVDRVRAVAGPGSRGRVSRG
jgi:glycosyltransferase involved in cell wall biosynthesis